MKENISLIASVILIAAATLTWSESTAQSDPVQSPPTFPVTPGPGAPPPAVPAVPPHKGFPAVRRAIEALRDAQQELQNSTNELQGHRQATIEECGKMIQDLQFALQDVAP